MNQKEDKTVKKVKGEKKNKDEDRPARTEKRWKDYLFIDPTNKFLQFYDTYMLLVIAFSCFSSAYYCAFDFPTEQGLLILEHFVFASFTFEIIFKCMRLPHNADVSERSHLQIIKRYIRSGSFFLDVTATFPFYLI